MAPPAASPRLSHLDVCIATWNMNVQEVPEVPRVARILGLDGQDRHDMYIFGTQEGVRNARELVLKLQEALGQDYVLVHSHHLMGIQLSLFLRKDLLWYISKVESAEVATKMGGILKTKVCRRLTG